MTSPPEGPGPAIEITPDMLAPKNPRIEFERGMSYLPRVTLLLIVAYIAVFVWEVATGALLSREAIIEAGALYRPLVSEGQIWRLLTATFLHGGPGHLIGNCVVFYIVGLGCEHAFGPERAIAVFGGSAVAGSLLSVRMQEGPSVGASGLIFGVMGALTVFLVRHRRAFYVRDRRIALAMGVFAVWILALGMLTPFVDNYAHLGGLLGGSLLALVIGGNPRLLVTGGAGHAPLRSPRAR